MCFRITKAMQIAVAFLASMLVVFGIRANDNGKHHYNGDDRNAVKLGACYPVADVVFLLDGSDSISEFEFEQQIELVQNFVKNMDIGLDLVRVGMMVVSSDIGSTVGLKDSFDRRTVLLNIKNLSQPQEGSRIDLGLVHLERMLYEEGRSGEAHIGVVLTDGRAKYRHAVEGEALALKETAHVHLISVGVGRLIQDGDLQNMASSTYDSFHLVPAKEALKRLLNATNFLGTKWCGGIAGTHPATPSPTTPRPRRPTTPATQPSPPTEHVIQVTTWMPHERIAPGRRTRRPKKPEVTAMPFTYQPTAKPTPAPTTVAPTTPSTPPPTHPPTKPPPPPSTPSPPTVPPTPRPTQKPATQAALRRYGSPRHQYLAPTKLFDIDVPLGVPFNFISGNWLKATPVPTPKPTTTPKPQPSTPDPSFHIESHGTRDLCWGSQFVDGVGYNADPKSCSEFIQCFYDDGKVTVERARCPFRMYWDQRLLLCRPATEISCWRDPCFDFTIQSYDHKGNCRAHWSCDNGLSQPKCCPMGFSYRQGSGCIPDLKCVADCVDAGEIEQIAPYASCRMTPFETNDRFYYEEIPTLGSMVRACPRGSRFNPELCTCDMSSDIADMSCRPELSLDFSDGFIDKSGNNLALTPQNVHIERGAARFDGDGKITLWRFSSFSFGTKLTITMRFKENTARSTGAPMHLVSNCCCFNNPGPSMDMAIIPNGKGRHGGTATFLALTGKSGEEITSVPYDNGEWKNITYIFDGTHLSGIVDGMRTKVSLDGEMEARPSALVLGNCDIYGGFNGLIDDVKLYLCIPGHVL